MNKDNSVWMDFLNGDTYAYAKIYELYAKQMYIYALHFTTNKELIEDSIHDVFVKLYNNRSKLSHIHNIKLYLFIALKNDLINQLNYSRTIAFEPIENMDSSIKKGPDTEEEYIKQESSLYRKELILKYYSILSLRQKEAIRYKFEDDLCYSQISKLMNINIQSVKNIVQSAIKKIKSEFSAD